MTPQPRFKFCQDVKKGLSIINLFLKIKQHSED